MTKSTPDTRDGVILGLIAYSSVAAFYSIFDVLAARGSLFTVNMLGRAVFRGLDDPIVLQYPTQLDTTAIFLYNAIHLLASLVIGLVVMRLVGEAERRPGRARLLTTVIVAGYLVTIALVGWLSTPIRPVLPWWSIVVANSAAVVFGGMYLARQRPGVLGRLVRSAA